MYLFLVFIFLISNNVFSKEKVYMQVIMDASGSMYQKVGEEHKIFTAKNLIRSFLIANSAIPEVNLSFRVYGTQDGSCEDTKLLIDFESMNTANVVDIVNKVTPKDLAKTPLARSLELAALDLKDKVGKRVIFLVTDGEETCGGDPCAVAKKLLKEFEIKIEVIGFDIEGAGVEEQLNCIASDKPYFAKNNNDLNEAINQINNKFAEKNLKIISPDPNVSVSLFSIKGKTRKLLRSFQAGIDQMVPATLLNEKYEVVVNFEKKYVFDQFILRADEKKILEVVGDGTLLANSVANLVNFKVLDQKGKEVNPNLKSNSEISLATGNYILNYSHPPYVLQENIPFFIVPNLKRVLSADKIGGLYIKTKEKVAYYIMDKEGKEELGTFLSNTIAILKVGTYKISILENKDLIEVDITPNELSFLNMELINE